MGKYINEKDFEIIKETAKGISKVKHGKACERGFHLEMPSLVGLKLTDMCNLRCKHCYEWSEHGYYTQRGTWRHCTEISLDVLKKIVSETEKNRAGLYLWGGEPLCYTHFDTLCNMLEGQNRQCAICTNSILIPDKLNSLFKIGKKLEIVIAMEGFQEDNDFIRGKGVFEKIIKSINILLNERKKGNFQGKITIHTVINQNNYSKLFEYVKFVENLGVDSLILCFPWYISDESEILMERCIQENFSWLIENSDTRSWKAFKYGLSNDIVDKLYEQLNLISNQEWKFNVRCFPKLEKQELKDFIEGKVIQKADIKKCNSISMRMDVMEDGTVSACKHFKEFVVGDLNKESIYEVWNSCTFNRIRKIMDKNLMPVCSQCNNLYLHSGNN